MIATTTTNTVTKRVCFPEEEVSVVHYVEKLDQQESEKLFYQMEDYIQFRANFNKFRSKQKQLLRFDVMTRQVRAELQASNQPKLVAAPLPTPLLSKPQRRRPATQRGTAAMA